MATMVDLPEEAKHFIEKIVSIAPTPNKIWLIGSWANNRVRTDSDIDLLVFGTEDYIESLKSDIEPPANIDVLVVYDGNNFKDPWKSKTGSLDSWKWEEISECEARYKGTKFIVDEESTTEFCKDKSGLKMGNQIVRTETAISLWRKS